MQPSRPTRRTRVHLAAWVLVLGFVIGETLCATDASRVAGRVFDPKGANVAGAQVTLTNAAGTVIRQSRSDEQGNFVLNGIDPGQYQLTAQATSFLTVISNVSVAAGQPTNVDLQFPADCLLRSSGHGGGFGAIVADARSRAEHHHP